MLCLGVDDMENAISVTGVSGKFKQTPLIIGRVQSMTSHVERL